jgi:hypothetical protein
MVQGVTITMRWQHYIAWDIGGMDVDLSSYSIEELYEMERQIDETLTQLRQEEPAAKRKYESGHQVWFAMCQHLLSELRDVRDAIVAKKSEDDVK